MDRHEHVQAERIPSSVIPDRVDGRGKREQLLGYLRSFPSTVAVLNGGGSRGPLESHTVHHTVVAGEIPYLPA